MRLSGADRVGIIALFAGILVVGLVHNWANTRTLIPVDIPVTLAPGHIQTGDFKINVKAYFSVQVRLPYGGEPSCGEGSGLRTRQLSSISGQVISAPGSRGATDNGVTRGAYLGSFWSKPGHYNLDIDVFSPTQYLDHCQPRLQIEAGYPDFAKWESIRENSFWFCLVCESLGIMLLILPTMHFKKESLQIHALKIFDAGVRTCPAPLADLKPRRLIPLLFRLAPSLYAQKATWGITGLRYRRFPVRRGWAMNPVMNLPTIALVCTLTWFIWLVPTWLVSATGQRSSQGLLVSLPWKGVPAVATASGLTAPLVRIDAKRHLYMNYKQTTWEELPEGLEQALLGLPVRVVYFEGDSDIPFMDAARAIDVIQGLGAKAILMTPLSKAENR